MSPILAEFIGTTILIVLGSGVVANVVLYQTERHNSGISSPRSPAESPAA